tara:strand:- start:10109 stop:10825 length:717 start_codon:yes stop_codon:yes gene_type:complete
MAMNKPTSDSTLAGGDINSSIRATFDDPSSTVAINFLSTSAIDVQDVSVTGRNAGGTIIGETVTLNGTNTVATSNTYERILTCVLSSGAAGVITASGNGVNKLTDIPVAESGFCRPFYDATASSSASKTLYDKVFVKNNNGTSTLNNATLIEVSSGLYSKIDFGLEAIQNSSQTVTNRTTAPTGLAGVALVYGAGPSGMVGDELVAENYQGVWLQLSLSAGETATNSYYQVQVSGTTA